MPIAADASKALAGQKLPVTHPCELIVHARRRIAVFGEDGDDDRTGQLLRPEADERRYDIESDGNQPKSIVHISSTFRLILDTRHEPMDDAEYQRNKRAYQIAQSPAVWTGAFIAFITFCAFLIAVFEIQEIAASMFALSLTAGSEHFVVIPIVTTTALKRE